MEQSTKRIKSIFGDHAMAAWWDYEKNNVPPFAVARQSNKIFFFFHNVCGHRFEMKPKAVPTDAPHCPYCRVFPLLCNNKDCLHCLNHSFAAFQLKNFIWHPTLNLQLEPHMILRGSGKKVHFLHEECQHSFLRSPNDITKSKRPTVDCPYCAPGFHILCGDLKCVICFERSLASVDLGELTWVVEKNAPMTIITVAKKATNGVWFWHQKCNHYFKMAPCWLNCPVRSGECPFCSARPKLCGEKDCTHCFKRSLAGINMPWLVWNVEKNGNILPHTILPFTQDMYHFDCSKCGHATITSAQSASTSISCKYCLSKSHCGDRNCQLCKNRSIMSLDVSKYLSPKNNNSIWMTPKKSTVSIIFDCPYCNFEYISVARSVSAGSWCKCRTNKTEQLLHDFLSITFPNRTIQREKIFDWCQNHETKRSLPFDFCIDDHILIELDGRQHFVDVPYFKTTATNIQQRDIYKMDLALKHGFRMIRLYQIDVWENQNNWKTQLQVLIENDTLKLSFVITDYKLAAEKYADYFEKWRVSK
jgi:hypothetical protein